MKRKEFEELKGKTVQELKEMVNNLKRESLLTKIEIKQGKIKNVHAYLNLRKKIAKILTLISEKTKK